MVEYKSVIIKYKKGVVKENADNLSAQNAEIKHMIRSINVITARVPENKIGEIRKDPDIEYIEMDQEAHVLGFPSEEIVRPFAEQSIPWGISKIRATEVWPAYGDKGTGIKVCVIDTGIDYNHPDLKDNYKGGYNFLNNTTNPMDDHGHGTHVSGTIAALDNDIGVIGVAPEAYIYSCKVLNSQGSGSYSNIIAAIEWAMNNNMQIISMSLGGSGFSQTLKDACDTAYNSGILVVASAGNSGCSGDTVGYPAKFDSVMAIAATDINDNRASFSSCGPAVEVSAPGVGVISTVPSGTCSLCDPSGYKSLNGTSMACPHVSGTAALVMKAHPELKNVDVRRIIGETAVHLGDPGRNIQYGFGRIDAKAAVDLIPPPQKKYKCSGAPDYQCIEDPNGPYDSLSACQAACTPAPTKKYSCTGAPNYACIEDPNGTYDSLEACQAACKAPAKRYSCSGDPSYVCLEDPNGKYDSLETCLAACRPAPAEKKFKIHTIGLPTNPTGVLVMKSSRGDYTAEEACKAVCDILQKVN